MELFEFETLSNQFLSSNPSVQVLTIQAGFGLDGVPDAEDFMPNDASQQYDSDSDGCGDNKAEPMEINSRMMQVNAQIQTMMVLATMQMFSQTMQKRVGILTSMVLGTIRTTSPRRE